MPDSNDTFVQWTPSSGATSGLGYDAPSSTRNESVTQVDEQEPQVAGLSEWRSSNAASPYRGRWVLLSDELQVIDDDETPAALVERHPQMTNPLVVFVPEEEPDVTLA
jgi:hypothetical protein